MARNPTVEQLARDLQSEDDDVLIMLWDAGFDYIRGPKSPLRPQDVSRARAAIGLAGPKEMQTVAYWLQRDGISRDEFARRLDVLGINLPTNARRLPKGAIRKLSSGQVAETQLESVATPSVAPEQDYRWEIVGKRRDVRLPTADEVERVHWALARDFADGPDPMFPAGVRDVGLFQSAVSRPETSLFGELKYPTAEMAATALMHSIIHNHPFHNGNKRTALVSMLVCLDQNELVVTCNQDELFKWIVRIAQHRIADPSLRGDRSDIEANLMARWVYDRSRPLGRHDRPMTWKALRPRLEALGCNVSQSGSNGGRINVRRDVSETRRGMLSKLKVVTRPLSTQLMYHGEGREVPTSTIRKIRQDLRLDEQNGVDSRAFYDAGENSPDEFISQYRKILGRLARM